MEFIASSMLDRMEAAQAPKAKPEKFDPYAEINKGFWPEDMAVPTDAEAIAGARLLLAEGFRFHEKRNLNRKWKFRITSGNRHTWKADEPGVFMVNPSYRWRPGWPGIIHSISHYVHQRVCPKLGGHEIHPMTEIHLAKYARERGFHLGRLKRAKMEKPPVDPRQVRLAKIDKQTKAWTTKAKRAATALKKLAKQRRYLVKVMAK